MNTQQPIKKKELEEALANGKPVTPEDFAKAYEELCSQMGYRVVAEPVFVTTNHNTFELSVRYLVVPINGK